MQKEEETTSLKEINWREGGSWDVEILIMKKAKNNYLNKKTKNHLLFHCLFQNINSQIINKSSPSADSPTIYEYVRWIEWMDAYQIEFEISYPPKIEIQTKKGKKIFISQFLITSFNLPRCTINQHTST